MATELAPIQAAEVATSAYALRLSSDMLDAAVAAASVRQNFAITKGLRLTGTTGVGFQASSGFGYVAWGSGSRQGECLISVRGTFVKSAYDWLTNARMGGSIGPSGFMVHTGFWRAAQSMLPQILKELGTVNRSISTLHIVGHSLGGAMAALIADRLSNVAGVKLYTFGAPRCGSETHSNYLTSQLGAANIYRLYHHTDPVPMVPIFPYVHVPLGGKAYLMPGLGHLVSVASHGMDQYERSVGQAGWNALPSMPVTLGSFARAEQWLSTAASSGGSGVMMSATALRLILSALGWILKYIGQNLGRDMFGATTVMDQLAQLLYSGILASIKIAEMVENLIITTMKILGRTVISGTKLTVVFIQYVLDLLFNMLGTLAHRAVDLLP